MAYNRKEEYLAVIKQPKEISDTLLETIDLIASARDAELSFDKTIIAEIVSLNNADTGEYFVEYQKGKFRAYTPTSLSYVYPKGTKVYVKVPGGDFTQKKIIEGKVSATSYSEEEYTALTQQIINISEIYTNQDEYALLAYAPSGSEYYEQVIYENASNEEDIVFTSLLNTYPNIMISADFRTNFYGSMVAGNYGLRIEFLEKDTSVSYTRNLDITNFSGSIYSYDTYSPQYAIYNLSDLNLQSIKKITFFQERFLRYDTIFNVKNEPIKVYDTDPNIFVKNIKVNIVDLQDTTKDLYYVGISAPQGLSLIQDTDKIKLTGVFYYAGKNILDKTTCQCYWYKQNPSVLSGNEKYDKNAGAGWECINETDTVNFNELTITGKDVYQQMRYKLVVIYNSNVSLYKEVRVVKYYNERFTIIRKDVSDTEVKLTIVDAQDKVKTADWFVDLLDGSYHQIGTGVSEVDISQYLDYGNITFYSISYLDNDYVPCEYQLITYQQEAPVRVVFEGNDSFQYDKNGSITYDQSTSEIVIKPNITVNKDNIGIKSITWYSPDGLELYELATNKVSNSMLTKLWVDKATNSLHFNIRQKFQPSYTNNTVQIKIITLADKEFYFSKTIIFIKTGEYTINGLDFSLTIKQCDISGNEINSFPLNKVNEVYTPIYFKPELRLDGELISNGTKGYEIAVEFEPINLTGEIQDNKNNIYKITNAEKDCSGQYFLKVIIAVGLKDRANTKRHLYYYQPVMVSSNLSSKLFGKTNIPTKITYDASGTASYDTIAKLQFYYNNKNVFNDNAKSITNTISIQKISNSDETYYYIYPMPNYDGAYFPAKGDTTAMKPMGALQIQIDKDNVLYYPIAMLKYQSTTDAGDEGTNLAVVDELSLERVKPLNAEVSCGELSGASGSTIIGKSQVVKSSQSVRAIANSATAYVSGVYQYDTDGVPANTLRSDGVAVLGGNNLVIDTTSVQINEKATTNILTISKLLEQLKTNSELRALIKSIVNDG